MRDVREREEGKKKASEERKRERGKGSVSGRISMVTESPKSRTMRIPEMRRQLILLLN